MRILSLESLFKSGVEILLLLQAKISMSKSPNDVDTLYKNWCNLSKGVNESVNDYIVRVVQFKKDLYGTEKEVYTPESLPGNGGKDLMKSLPP